MIVINSPKGQGYIACMNGQSPHANPHYGVVGDILCKWFEWNEGWHQAYDEGKFGVNQ